MQDGDLTAAASASTAAALASLLPHAAATISAAGGDARSPCWHDAAAEYGRASLAHHLIRRVACAPGRDVQASGASQHHVAASLSAPHHDQFISACLCADSSSLPASVRACALAAAQASAAANAVDAAPLTSQSGEAASGVLEGANPWSLSAMHARAAAGDPSCTLHAVAQAAFLLAALACQPSDSPVAALPLLLTSSHAQTPARASTNSDSASHAGAVRLFWHVFDSPEPREGAPVAGAVARWLLKTQPWSLLGTCDAPVMSLFVCAIALGMRSSAGHVRPYVSPPGVVLQLALVHCEASDRLDCAELVSLAASLEHRAPPGEPAAPPPAPGGLVDQLQRLCAACAPAAFRWHATAALAAWWLEGETGRGAIVWMLAKRLTHTEVLVEAVAADALAALAQMQGTSARGLLLHCGHVMRDAGLHAGTHGQVRFRVDVVLMHPFTAGTCGQHNSHAALAPFDE